jgi:TetR/AcrR family transcriptional regulator
MVNPEPSSEERIMAAARVVFLKHGFAGARMQEIADTAGINKALLHYYYRSKENLFMAIFREAFSRMASRMIEIFRLDEKFERKLELFYDYHISFLQENPYVPWFILNGLYEKPQEIKRMFEEQQFVPEDLFSSLSRQLQAEGVPVENMLQLYVNILALSVFPVIAKPLLSQVLRMTDHQMEQFYLERKILLPQFIMNAITTHHHSK